MKRTNNKVKTLVWFLLALLVVAAAVIGTLKFEGSRRGDALEVVRATLSNGLRVVIVRNALAPVVSTNVNYLVGADETPEGFPGMAHALEHMMFRGSPDLSADQLANIGSIIGGDFNAATRQTATQYFYTVPAADLDVALHIEALRMKDLLSTQEDWERERGAIEQEVAQGLSSPLYILFTQLRSTLFAGTPYAHDALGTVESFRKTTGAMLKDFHSTWYAPNNAILVIVGDVEPRATLDKVRDLFASIPAKTLPPRPEIKLGAVTPKSLTLDSDLPYGLQVIALRFPGIDSEDFAAAEVLVDVLKSQRGELYGLVPQGKALGVDFSFDPLPKSGLAFAVAAFPVGGDAKALEAEMRSILSTIAKSGVPADLVAAAKLEEKRAAELQKNSIAGLASVWSEALAIYGLQSPDEDLARIEKVTVEDVNRVARKYLLLDQVVTAVLTPQGSGKAVASQGFGGQEKITLGEAKPTPLPEWATDAMNRMAVPESNVKPTVSTLSNGITLIVQPVNVSNTISVYGHIRNRPELQVPAGKEGLSDVVAELFQYGSKTLNRVSLRTALDVIGADARAGTDFELQTLTESFDRGVELLADNLLNPGFPDDAFKVVKQQVAQTVAGQLSNPTYLSTRALLSILFPKADPVLREPLPETVNAIAIDDVRAYYDAVFRPDVTTIVIIGKVTPAQAKNVIEKYFSGWRATGPPPITVLPPVPLSTRAISHVPDNTRVQDRVTLAQTLGLNRLHEDFYALQLGNNVLGGSFYSTRLTRDIRKDAGLVYAIDSDFEFSQTRGIYFVQYACDPQNVSRVHDMVLEEVRRMQREPVSDDELQRAKALLLRRISLSEASTSQIARGIIRRNTLGLPLDEPTRAAQRYLSLTATQVQAAFAKWLRVDDLARVSQGPPGR